MERAGRRRNLLHSTRDVMVTGFAWTYVKFGSLPQIQGVLYGVKPVIIAVVFSALWNLGRAAVKDGFPALPRIRKSRLAGAFLDGVNVGAVALMIAVTVATWPRRYFSELA